MKKKLLIQFNIPFCYKRCTYCAVPVCRYDTQVMHAYVDAMVRELEAAGEEMEEYEVVAVSIEGGSPVLAEPSGLQRLLLALRKSFHVAQQAQICLQTMPGDYSRALMQRLRDSGVNHWIFGIQTADAAEHALLGRPYRYDALSMVDVAVKTFDVHDRSFELLYGIPGQTMQSWKHTLEAALYYAPEHVTLVPLQLQKGTELYAKYLSGQTEACPEDRKITFYRYACERLEALGYHAYTTEDFARPGAENRYRLGQLAGTEQLGIGYGAAGLLDGVAYTNGHSLREYLEHAEDPSVTANQVVRLTDEHRMRRELQAELLQLRGVKQETCEARYGASARQLFGEHLKRLQERGYLECRDDSLYLTASGIVNRISVL